MKYTKHFLLQSPLARREDGVSAVEFGLILPVFVVLLMGIAIGEPAQATAA